MKKFKYKILNILIKKITKFKIWTITDIFMTITITVYFNLRMLALQ